MADRASVAARGRPNTSVDLSNTPKKIDLANVALTARDNELIDKIASLCADRPLPNHIPAEEFAKPVENANKLIETAKDFYHWFDNVNAKLIDDVEKDKYELYLDQLNEYKSLCDNLIAEIDFALKYLKEVEEKYSTSSRKTGELHSACEGLLHEEKQLRFYADDLREKLKYFNELESLSKKFNSPSLSVQDEHFLPLLRKLDECIDFIQKNPGFKESEVYLLKYRQLQGRGLTLVRNYVINTFKDTASHVLTQLKTQKDATSLIFYVDFKLVAPKVKPLCTEIENRSGQREYAALLSDCHTVYFQQRRLLLHDLVSKNLLSVSTTSNDLTAATRDGCSYLLNICQLEHDLFCQFFTATSTGLRMLLEGFSTTLYDNVRPVIIRCSSLEVLCNLVNILKKETLEEQILPKGESLVAFKPVVTRLIEDVQERLIFVAQTYMRDKITDYVPKPADLNYPDKLIEAKKGPVAQEGVTSVVGGTAEQLPADPVPPQTSTQALTEAGKEFYATWYPTLEHTLKLLFKLYYTVDIDTFNGLAQEMVSACTRSLCNASQLIEKQKGKFDAQLFLVKYLTTLSDQLLPFDINFSIKEKALDFSSLMGKVRSLINSGVSLSSLNPRRTLYNFYSFVYSATPQLKTMTHDLRVDMEQLLKETLELFIVTVTRHLIDDLLNFLTQATLFINAKKGYLNRDHETSSMSNVSMKYLKDESYATPDKLNELMRKTMQSLTDQLPLIVNKLVVYIDTAKTREAIYGAIKDNIATAFTKFNTVIAEEFSAEDRANVTLMSLVDVHRSLDSAMSDALK
jgi:hypothetical protein